jgi:hypothetical protein
MLRVLFALTSVFAIVLGTLPASAQGLDFQCSVESSGNDVVLTYAAPNTQQGLANAGAFCTNMIQSYGLMPVTKYVNLQTTQGFTPVCQASLGSDAIDVWALDNSPNTALQLCDALIADGRYPVSYL